MLPPGFWDSERARLSADIADTVLRVLIAGGTSGVELLPQSARVLVNWDIFNQHATDWLKIFLGDVSQPAQFADQNRVAWNWARELTDVTRRGVMDDINAWVQSGDPLPELEKRLMRNQAFSSNRARMVAATEVTRTYASGNLMAWSASGLVSGKRWRTAVDERVCPICGPMHMTIVEIDQDWQFTQDMREASPELDRALKSIGNAAFTAPPAHVNCRCWLSPVVFEAMDPDELEEQRFDKDQRRAGQVQPVEPVLPEPVPAPAAPPGGPLGTQISDTIRIDSKIPRGGKVGPRIRGAIEAIDSTHGDGTLQPVNLKLSSGQGRVGEYAHDIFGKPVHIKVSRAGQHQGLTTAHEIGHYLDQQYQARNAVPGQPIGKWLSLSDEAKEWREAIANSRLHTELDALYSAGKIEVTLEGGGIFEATVNKQYVRYLQSTKEYWARSYAQYIATQSGNKDMLTELFVEQSADGYKAQWDDDDFEPIAQAFTAMFRRLGWLR